MRERESERSDHCYRHAPALTQHVYILDDSTYVTYLILTNPISKDKRCSNNCMHAEVCLCVDTHMNVHTCRHVYLKYRIVHGDADAHWPLCVSPCVYQLPPDPQIQRPQQGLKHRISTDIIWKRSLFFFPLLSHEHPIILFLIHSTGYLFPLFVFHLSIYVPHILN